MHQNANQKGVLSLSIKVIGLQTQPFSNGKNSIESRLWKGYPGLVKPWRELQDCAYGN